MELELELDAEEDEEEEEEEDEEEAEVTLYSLRLLGTLKMAREHGIRLSGYRSISVVRGDGGGSREGREER